MRSTRHAGQVLILGIALPLLIIGLHPTAHDLTAEAGSRLATVNRLVHGIALAAQPLIFLGLLGLTQYLQWSELAIAALVSYGFGIIGTFAAAVMSGFVAPEVIAQIRSGDTVGADQYRHLLDFTHSLNQGFAKVAVVASGTALMLWGFDSWRSHRLSRTAAAVGVLAGGTIALGVLFGFLRLDVRGILLTTFLQAAWMALVAVQMIRSAPAPPT